MSDIGIIETDHAPAAVGTYSQGVIYNNFCFFSGQIGIDPITNKLELDFDSQLSQILKNIDAMLKSQRLERSDILKTTIFLTDLSQFSKVNQAYQNYFDKPYPARSCVEVSKLPKDALVEIEVFARKP